MLYTWRDVKTEDFPLIDGWLDEEAVGFTGLDEGFGTYYGYWLEEPETIPGENFWVKLFCRDGIPLGVVAISLWEGVFTLSELVVAPALRGKGLGTAVLRELLAEGKEILSKPIHSARAVIFPGNHASRRAFEKAGFVYASTHPDGDAEYYRYERFTFRPLEKESQGEVLPGLFAILHGNMDAIAPTGKGYEEDESLWCSCIGEALEKEPRRLLVIRDGETVAGFFMYYVNGSLFMMEEIQFSPAYQGSGLFRALYAHLAKILPPEVEFVEAYANKKNEKSQGILARLGLERIGENKNGNSYHFRGRYEALKKAVLG